MEVNTRDFGIIEVENDAVYEFPDGLYGFEEDKKFAIIDRSFEDVSFLYLQSVDNTVPCFLVFEPWDLHPHYKPVLSKEDMDICQVESINDLMFLVIAVVPSSIRDLSINIKSPIVLNPKTRKARQVILQNPDYNVKYLPFQQDGKAGI
ncbi:MAG: flagellar assembly protein FliW [Eubacteriales bacterium]|nr:flagellar assembly protein FliW [Eubacteriales bacterium]MDD3199238.1 flagellar assembly protein FliW [Eubacteriales bacterium]MDD4122155.1 flagellar assembly protein FliW [Eubacteriales bacterium]MDD4629369.1 flagellar assembly protein FliW [Eubacteriales bacterium]